MPNSASLTRRSNGRPRPSPPHRPDRTRTRRLPISQKAYDLTKGSSELAALAAAHAELGEFDKAVEWQTKALASASARPDAHTPPPDLSEGIRLDEGLLRIGRARRGPCRTRRV